MAKISVDDKCLREDLCPADLAWSGIGRCLAVFYIHQNELGGPPTMTLVMMSAP